MWNKKGENLTYKFFKLVKEQQMSTSAPQQTMAGAEDLKISERPNNFTDEIFSFSKIKDLPLKSSIQALQTVLTDIIFGDAHLKKNSKLKPDGILGPRTWGALKLLNVDQGVIGKSPDNKESYE